VAGRPGRLRTTVTCRAVGSGEHTETVTLPVHGGQVTIGSCNSHDKKSVFHRDRRKYPIAAVSLLWSPGGPGNDGGVRPMSFDEMYDS